MAFTFTPAKNSHTAPINTTLVVDMGGTVDENTVNASTFVIHASLHAPVAGSFNVVGQVITFTPTNPFWLNEKVEVTLTAGIKVGGSFITPYVWQFWITSGNKGTGFFTDSGQNLGNTRANQEVLGDFRGVGILDLIVANWKPAPEDTPAVLQENNGSGVFSFKQTLSEYDNEGVAVGDFRNSGKLDVVFNAYSGDPDTVWFNDGEGVFSKVQEITPDHNDLGCAVGDLDGDGFLDYVAVGAGINIYHNDGAGGFVFDRTYNAGTQYMYVVIADFNNDGRLDLLVAKNPGCQVWLNNGDGTFTMSQAFGNYNAYGCNAGDFNNDGFMDVILNDGYHVGQDAPQEIWLNDGDGTFTFKEEIGNFFSENTLIADLNGDGNLDLFLTVRDVGCRVYFGDGTGHFADSGQTLGTEEARDGAFGDIRKTGILDAVIGGAIWTITKVWFQNYADPKTLFRLS